MTTSSIASGQTEAEARNYWVPMIAIALGKVLMSFSPTATARLLGQLQA